MKNILEEKLGRPWLEKEFVKANERQKLREKNSY